MARRRQGAADVVAVVLADTVLEAADSLTFAAMAVTSTPGPAGRQWVVLASLILPRLAAAGAGAVVLRGLLGLRRLPPAAVVIFLTVLAGQAAAGLFLLWGQGQTLAGRLLLAGVNLAAIVRVARSRPVAPAVSHAPHAGATRPPEVVDLATGPSAEASSARR